MEAYPGVMVGFGIASSVQLLGRIASVLQHVIEKRRRQESMETTDGTSGILAFAFSSVGDSQVSPRILAPRSMLSCLHHSLG
jgi:hypothetical protein